MKKLTEKKWFWPVAVIAAVLVIALILFFCGFCINYILAEQKNKLEAVSACAAWVGIVVSIISVLISGLAIYYAIKVPKTIAEQQNKIALFEKRYEVYDALTHFISFCYSMNDLCNIKSEINSTQICQSFISSFSHDYTTESTSKEAVRKECTKYLINAQNTLDTASFLFDCDTADYCQPMISILYDLLYSIADSERIREYGIEYIEKVHRMKQELLPQIKRELALLK